MPHTLQDLMTTIGIPDTASVPDHHNKTNVTIEQVRWIFGFPIHIKVMFTLYCCPLSVQYITSKKKQYPNLKILIAK